MLDISMPLRVMVGDIYAGHPLEPYAVLHYNSYINPLRKQYRGWGASLNTAQQTA